MVQRREELRFALEPREALTVVRKLLGEDLDRHLAAELGIASAVDLAHATLADEGGDLVRPEPGCGGE